MVVTRRKRQETPHCIQNTKTAKCSQKGCMMKAHTSRTTVWAKRSDPGVDAGPLVHEGGSERGRGPHRPEVRPPTADPERGLPLPHGPGGWIGKRGFCIREGPAPHWALYPPRGWFFLFVGVPPPPEAAVFERHLPGSDPAENQNPPPSGMAEAYILIT